MGIHVLDRFQWAIFGLARRWNGTRRGKEMGFDRWIKNAQYLDLTSNWVIDFPSIFCKHLI